MTTMTYSQYLRLKQLLSLQQPLTPRDDREIHDGERLFIVVHQASETLLSQALTDLRHIEAGLCDSACSDHRANRAARVVETLESHLVLLRNSLKPEHFQLFRDRFGTASGLQSKQFHELFEITHRLAQRRAAGGVESGGIELAERELVRLRAATRSWRYTHLKLVEHMLGDLEGTGETSGVDYLRRRIDEAAAESAVGDDGGTTEPPGC
ncbi:Tryptophan 2,3-dioxygenase (vermilion) [Actinopolyspora alba]|uniref:Tryptophan 2,3-dioxygenase (Vermilion) n=2 Tax=Actinopolyspora alba TaxID=673379 RepID=A0A1I1U0V6_9ACTN|nr:Tryptophan 2,3-dioxygenase (vermilion) [Actinopolyspora alba]